MGILSGIKTKIVGGSEKLLKTAWGMEFLDKEQTISYLNEYLLAPGQSSLVHLPEITNVVNPNEIIFSAYAAPESRNHVWNFKAGLSDSSLMRIGSVLTNNKVLQTDFGYPLIFTHDYGGKYIFKDFFSRDQRDTIHVDDLIAPWSHYFRKEYYMYVMRIAAKICRIKEVLPEEVFDKAVISYPLYDTNFEADYLSLLGITPDRIIDSRKKKIRFKQCFLGNNDDLINTNVQDIMALKRQLEPALEELNKGAEGNKRIYICRSGRRRVVNETELIRMLEEFGFDIYEDKPRSVAEQYAMYHNASFIIGPHGSSFTNVVWCKPGAQLLELIPPRYVYNYFLYLSTVVGVKYSAYCNGPVAYDYRNKTINDDITVEIPELRKYLEGVFSA